MNYKKPTATLLFISAVCLASAQTSPTQSCAIHFEYDNAGNRTSRLRICTVDNPPPAGKTDEFAIAEEAPAEENNDWQKQEDHLQITVLFPNPTSALCIVSLSRHVSNALLTLYDSQGRLVRHERVSGKDLRLDLSKLTPGTYFVNVRQDHEAVSKPVVKN